MVLFDIASFDMQNREFEARYKALVVRTIGSPTSVIVSSFLVIFLLSLLQYTFFDK